MINRIRKRIAILIAKPDPAWSVTERNRHERERRVAMSGDMSAASTAVAMAVSFISIPLTVGYLGTDRYGVWVTIGSLLSWVAIVDMGFGGVALVNAMSEARGRDDADHMRSLVSTALFALSLIALALLVVFAACFPFVPWHKVLNVSAGMVDGHELHIAVALAFVGFALLFPLSLTSAVFTSLQEAYVSHAWNIAAHLASLAALIVVSKFEGGLPLLVLALTFTRSLVVFGATIYLFTRRHPELRPRLSFVRRNSLARLGGLGWKYLLQQLANIGMFQSQPMLVTHQIGPGAVGIYNVAYRILAIPQALTGFFLLPLVPAYGEARARKDWDWIWRTLRRTTVLSLLVGLAATAPLALALDWIVDAWIGHELIPPTALICWLAAYTVLTAVAAPFAVFFNGIERVGSMASIGLANAAVTITLAFALLPVMGIAGMGAAMAIGFAATNVLGQLWLVAQVRRDDRIRGGRMS